MLFRPETSFSSYLSICLEEIYAIISLYKEDIQRTQRVAHSYEEFITSCLILALDQIHGSGYIHRDLKPENILLDKDGYVRVTDFGVARQPSPKLAADSSGTPGYMAPEVMFNRGHGFESDFYALGVIVYEMLMGKRPYQPVTRKELKEAITAKGVKVEDNPAPYGWSSEGASFINGLLNRKPEQRLGFNGGCKELMIHPWLSNFDWSGLKQRKIKSPIQISEGREYFDHSHANKADPHEDLNVQNCNLEEDKLQQYFEGYDFPNFGKPLLSTGIEE